MSYDDLKRKH